VRFEAEDGSVKLGQPVDAELDVGLAFAEGKPVEVYVIEGTLYDGKVTKEKTVIKQLLSPVSKEECSIIRCLGLNYKAHQQESGMAMPEAPILFIKSRTALAGPGSLPVDKVAQDQLDFETELCLVIGKDARNVKAADAFDYILGFTASNDVSVRKVQLLTSQWCFGKGFDASCPIGPVLVRRSAIDGNNIPFKGVLSGKVMQESNTNDMIFNIADTIQHLSTGTTLEKGSLILMGTPSGIGWARTPKRLIQDGEEMKIWFGGGIGTLVNTFKFD